jgi:hypothetical protein
VLTTGDAAIASCRDGSAFGLGDVDRGRAVVEPALVTVRPAAEEAR